MKSTRRNSEGTIKWGETWMGENVLRMRGRTGGEDDVVYDTMERISEVVWDEGRAGEGGTAQVCQCGRIERVGCFRRTPVISSGAPQRCRLQISFHDPGLSLILTSPFRLRHCLSPCLSSLRR